MIQTLTLDKEALVAIGHALTASLHSMDDAALYDRTQSAFQVLSAHSEIVSFNFDLADSDIQRAAGILVSLGLPVITQTEQE